MKILEKIISFFLICWYGIFDFKNHKIRSSIIAILLLAILLMYGASFMINKNSDSEVQQTRKIAMQTQNSSSIDESTKSEYSNIRDELYNDNLSKEKREELERKQGQIQSAEHPSYTVVSPGEFQLDKLKILTDHDKTYKAQNDVLNKYSLFTAGETIWLFENWINNLANLPKDQFKASFDEINGNLFINDTYLDDEQKEYLISRCNMIWEHSELEPRVGKLNIEFVSASHIK